MKDKIISIILSVGLIALVIIGIIAIVRNCPKQIGEKPIDARHTDAYVGIVTDYEYVLDLWGDGGFKKMPNTHSKSFPEKWEICYQIEYNNGTTKTEWREVTKQEYEDFLKGAEE